MLNKNEYSQMYFPNKQFQQFCLNVSVKAKLRLSKWFCSCNQTSQVDADSYVCILNIEGTEESTKATRIGDEFTCTSKMVRIIFLSLFIKKSYVDTF